MTGEVTADAETLDDLLRAMDYVPLAVELLAHAALAEPDLSSLAARWERERAELLQRGGGDDPLLSVGASVEVSLAGPLMTEAALRLLTILALLPEGVAHADLDDLMPDAGRRGAARLRQLALADDVPGRLRALQPIREHVRAGHTPAPGDADRVVAHYLQLGSSGDRVGWDEGAAVAERLMAESGNVEAVFELAQPQRLRASVDAAVGLATKFYSFTGVSSVPGFRRAAAQAAAVGAVLGEANCIKGLGDLAYARSDHDTARTHYEEALERYTAAERPWSIGLAHQALARVARDDEERNHHVEFARATWQGIGFDHLIAELDAEVGAAP